MFLIHSYSVKIRICITQPEEKKTTTRKRFKQHAKQSTESSALFRSPSLKINDFVFNITRE